MSKYQRGDPPALPRHRHCNSCGSPVDMGKEFCSDKCRVAYKRSSRAKTRTFILVIAAVLIFYLFIVFGRL
ncbi:MAG TPA: DUF2116 family Zn-ribbon domain-containing protein [Candidatus Bathyarchaeia archaeon]